MAFLLFSYKRLCTVVFGIRDPEDKNNGYEWQSNVTFDSRGGSSIRRQRTILPISPKKLHETKKILVRGGGALPLHPPVDFLQISQ